MGKLRRMWGKIVAVLFLLLAVVGCQKPPPEYESSYTTPPPAAPGWLPAERPAFNPDVIGEALQSSQPYVISVLGDSTGNSPDEWVHLVAQRIAEDYGREVTVNGWDANVNRYGYVSVYGTGPPVTVWNASAPGEPAQYSLEWYPQMGPEQVDLTFINHSHNQTGQVLLGVADLVDTAYANTAPGGGVAAILQNPRNDAPAQEGRQMVERLREIYSDPEYGVVTVDVFSAFSSSDDFAALLEPDGAHPNPRGSQLWADTVMAALNLS